MNICRLTGNTFNLCTLRNVWVMSKVLSLILDVLDKVSLVDQEKIALVPRKYIYTFSKVLELYQTVLVLAPDVGSKVISGWRFIYSKPLKLENQLIKMRQAESSDYEKLSDILVSYMSPRATSFVTFIAGLRDESLVVTYNVLKSMQNLGITPHILLFLDLNYKALSDFDKVNIASVVSRTIAQGKYTIVPFSHERVMKSSARMGVVDYVKKCLSDIANRLHEHPVTGTYVPLCFRLEPASIFKDVLHALNLVFYIFTGFLKFPAESLFFGSIDVWKDLREKNRELEKLVGDKVEVNYIDNDRLDVRALAEFSLRDIIAEGINTIGRDVSSGEVVEILTNLRFLDAIKV